MPKLSEILGDSFVKLPENIKEKYKDIDLVDSNGYIEKSELNTLNDSIKEYKKQLKDRDKQLEELKDKAQGNDELTTEIRKLKEFNEKTKNDYESKIKQMSFDTKFEKALTGYKPKNAKALKALLDMQKISLDGENFIGLEDQIKSIKESDPYLFSEENAGGTGKIGNPAAKNHANETIGSRLAKEKVEQQKATQGIEQFYLK